MSLDEIKAFVLSQALYGAHAECLLGKARIGVLCSRQCSLWCVTYNPDIEADPHSLYGIGFFCSPQQAVQAIDRFAKMSERRGRERTVTPFNH